jgi:hypothetical protein
VIIGTVPVHDENGSSCSLLREVPVERIAPEQAESRLGRLRGTNDDADSPPRGLLALERTDIGTGTGIVFLVNRSDEPVSWSGAREEVKIVAELDSRGFAVLVVKDGRLNGYLVAGPGSQTRGTQFTVGTDRVSCPPGAYAAAGRIGDGWESVLVSESASPYGSRG